MTTTSDEVKAAAEEARRVGQELADLVHDKQLAYGDAAGLQARLWGPLLEKFRSMDGKSYLLPVRFMLYDVPRLTRVFDRIARIVAGAEEGDAMGESPWRDLAGDAIVGASIQPDGPIAAADGPARCPHLHPANGKQCEKSDNHVGSHGYVHAGGVVHWEYNTSGQSAETDVMCGDVHEPTGRVCTRKLRPGATCRRHYAAPRPGVDEKPLSWWDGPEVVPPEADNDTYTHGYTPEDDD